MLHWVKRQGFNKEEYTDNIAHSSTCRGSSLKVARSMFYLNFENRKERKKNTATTTAGLQYLYTPPYTSSGLLKSGVFIINNQTVDF